MFCQKWLNIWSDSVNNVFAVQWCLQLLSLIYQTIIIQIFGISDIGQIPLPFAQWWSKNLYVIYIIQLHCIVIVCDCSFGGSSRSTDFWSTGKVHSSWCGLRTVRALHEQKIKPFLLLLFQKEKIDNLNWYVSEDLH